MDRVPTASQLLSVWEQGVPQTHVQRAFSLLALAVPTASAEDLARFGIGQRDEALFALRQRIFGAHMTGMAECPACGQKVELGFSVDDVRGQLPANASLPQILQQDGYDVRFRLPDCSDLAALESSGELGGGKYSLLRRCVIAAHRDGEAVATSELPDTVTRALSERMAALDPQGDTQLTLRCPKCAHAWQAPVDIASYLWTEIQAWAERMLHEVHTLAGAYGWREHDILAMGPRRRQAYLEMVRQ